MIPFVDFKKSVTGNHSDILSAVESVLDSGEVILGLHLKRFESEFASFCNTKYCIGVANGLDALVLALRACGVGSGDEVLVPAQTFVATWLAVSHVGATPIEVDVVPDTLLINTKLIKNHITSKTKAIIPVHLFGQPVDVDLIRNILLGSDVKIIEDAAQAHGAILNGKKVGALGDAAAFSFYPTKNLGAIGDGGAITTNNESLAEKIRMLRNYGSKIKYNHEIVGFNSRLDDIQAAILSKKLKNLDAENELRIKAANRYDQLLRGVDGVRILTNYADRHVYHLYVVLVEERDFILSMLNKKGVNAAIHYPIAPGDLKAYNLAKKRPSCIEARRAAATSLSLPFWPYISFEQQELVVTALRDAILQSR
jgi:dTDP-3-amino-3,4,6-trideoxy-alpha-D-glucose transaminase